MQQLRVVTYNIKSGIYHPEGLEAVARVLEQLDADVVALQEVDRGTRRSHDQDQAAWLANRLGLPYHCFGAATPWEGGGEYGVALLGAEPLERVETHQLWVPHGQSVPHGEREPRVLLSARLLDRGVTVMVTHLGLGEEQRTRQASQIAELALATPDEVILMGDLNGRPDSAEVLALSKVLRDVMAELPENERITFPSGDPEKIGEDYMARTIDYIMVTPGVAVRTARAVPEYTAASDHNPCVAELELKAATAQAPERATTPAPG